MSAHKVLMEFLVEIQVSRGVDWGPLAATLVDRASSSQASGAGVCVCVWVGGWG